MSATATETKPAENPTPAPAATPAPTPALSATPAPAAPAAVAAPAVPTPDAAALSAKAVEDERTRVSEITALCNRAGKPDLALSAVKDGRSVDAVRKDLLDSMLSSNKPVGDSDGADPLAKPDPDKKYREEFAAARDVYLRQGVSEDSYIRSRRRDDGLPVESVAAK